MAGDAERELKRLLNAADKARAQGEKELASYLAAEAAQTLTDAGKVHEAIELFISAREFAPAAELYEKQNNYLQAARLWFLAGDLPRAAHAHLLLGDEQVAAELFERAKEWVKAAVLYERRGELFRAAELFERGKENVHAARLFRALVAADHPEVLYRVEEICLRAGMLLVQVGKTADAIVILRHGNQLARAGKQLVQERQFDQAIELLEAAGEKALAAEAYKRAAHDQRATSVLTKIQERERGEVVTEELIESEAPVMGTIIGGELYPAAARLVALARSGELSRYDEAIRLLVQVSPNDRDYAVARRLLIACYQEVGEPEKARQLSAPARAPSNLLPPLPPLQNMMLTATQPIGSTLRGRFRVEAIIGKGSQAIVYRATDVTNNRPLAVKIATTPLEDGDEDLDRFMREVRIAARVHHPHCVSVYDFGRENGLTFMAMELVEGHNLSQELQQGPLAPVRAIRVARQVADALTAVHREGIVHRDLKPANIMIDEHNDVRLMDFGIAKVLGEETTSGTMIGTISYMSPEQARGKELDARADIFSLGVVLYEMLCGRRPWGNDLAALAKRSTELPPPLPAELLLPEIAGDAVHKCMQPRPEDRYASMEQLMVDLDVVLDSIEVEDDEHFV